MSFKGLVYLNSPGLVRARYRYHRREPGPRGIDDMNYLVFDISNHPHE